MTEPQSPYHPDLEVTITVPLDVFAIVLETANRLGIQYVPSRDRWALEVAQREYEMVREMVGLAGK